jgi:hypothetical protein
MKLLERLRYPESRVAGGSERVGYAPKKPLSCPVVPAEHPPLHPIRPTPLDQGDSSNDAIGIEYSPFVLDTLHLADLEWWHAKGHKPLHLYNSCRFRGPQSHLSTGSLRLSTALR